MKAAEQELRMLLTSDLERIASSSDRDQKAALRRQWAIDELKARYARAKRKQHA